MNDSRINVDVALKKHHVKVGGCANAIDLSDKVMILNKLTLYVLLACHCGEYRNPRLKRRLIVNGYCYSPV